MVLGSKIDKGAKRVIYDEDAGLIDTPAGPGRFVGYDGATGVVTVELDNQYLVFYSGSICFVREVRS